VLLRSVSQGTLFVLFSLYLINRGWSATQTGTLFAASGLFVAVVSSLVGAGSDRWGAKRFLILQEGMTAGFALLLVFVDSNLLIILACVVAGLGRMQSGVPGLATAAEQAWMASAVKRSRRGIMFSANSAVGFTGMALGAGLSTLEPSLRSVFETGFAYEPFFLFTAVVSALNALLLSGSEESLPKGDEQRPDGKERQETTLRSVESTQTENRNMIKLAGINSLSGIAIGLTSPLLVYWFNYKFGVGTEAIGTVLSVSYLATAIFSILTGLTSQRRGLVRTVVAARLVTVALFAVIPLMPTFGLASAAHIARSALSRGSIGARRAIAVNLVGLERRGLVSGVNNVSLKVSNSVGSAVAGVFLNAGLLALPFFVAAGMQLLYGMAYGRAFSKYDQSS
jgi:MFS family permease